MQDGLHKGENGRQGGVWRDSRRRFEWEGRGHVQAGVEDGLQEEQLYDLVASPL